MGALVSTIGRRNGGVEEVDISGNNAYKYPPKSGNYFGSHFIMGGERFDMSQPEAYLFGENSDLNFLGNKPVPFPYPPAAGNEPTKTLKSLVNIRKDSLRLVRIPEAEKLTSDEQDENLSNKYNLEFTFDADVKCSVRVFYFCTEEITNSHISYNSKYPQLTSELYHYKRGAGQVFQQSSHVIDPSSCSDDQWQFCPERDDIPVVIQCLAEDDDNACHAHMTFAVIERSSLDGCYIIKPLKQKQFVHGLCYLLQEIYGIENKNDKVKEDDDGEDELEDSGAECVICMSDMRDTLILPCRHLCLCSTCAESLRYQASSCPICRSPFRALLQIRAMRRKQVVALQQGDPQPEENPVSQEGVPPGYEAVSLIEALNGPCGLPPFNTMEGIHVPPPSRYPHVDNESHHKRRSSKKHTMPVETVKELHVLSAAADDKKIAEEKEDTGDRTDTSGKTQSSVPLAEATPPKATVLQKARTRAARHRKAGEGDNMSLPRSPSSDQDKEDNMTMVNEVKVTPKKTISPRNVEELKVSYPPLTVSSENLADDEREDTSEGEVEPEPDYDLDDCCVYQDEEDFSEDADLSELGDTAAYLSPPDYATAMCHHGAVHHGNNDEEEVDSGQLGAVEDDTDEMTDSGGTLASVKLQLSTSPPGSSDSTASNLSSHGLLAEEKARAASKKY